MTRKRVICLYRVSTKKQVEKDDIPMQRQFCHEFADHQPGWEIIDEKCEKGVSGFKTHADQRDAILELRTEAELKSFDILLVYMMDRLGRIAEETPAVVSWFAAKGIEVWSATEGQQHFETQTDKLLNFIHFWQAEGESCKTSLRTKTRLGQIVQEGKFRGGAAPYGYRLEKQGRTNPRGREVNEILVDDEEAAVVSYIFELSAKRGYGSRKIATVLTAEGFLNRKKQPFHPSTIQNMLKNILYTGVLRSGESKSQIFPHLQIISPTDFELAQQQITTHRLDYDQSRLSPVDREGQALLSGNVFCGTCGARLISTTARATHHATAHKNPRVPMYRCYNRMRHKEQCDGQSSYRAEKIDAVVEQAVQHILSRIRVTDEKKYLFQRRQQQLAAIRAQSRRLESDYLKATEERKNLARHMGAALDGTGPFTADDLKEQMDVLKEECDRLAAQMEVQRDLMSRAEQNEQFISQQFHALQDYAQVYDHATVEEKRRIVSALIERVSVSRGYDIQITFRVGLDMLEELTPELFSA